MCVNEGKTMPICQEKACRRPRLCALDLVRVAAILFVMIFHFQMGEVGISLGMWKLGGLTLGELGVSMFFILSGASLRYSDEGRYSLARFVRNRILAIYPMFLIGFVVAHWAYLIWFGGWGCGPFVGVPKWKIVYSLLGIDGWLGFTGYNFCVVGEWFLGCLIMIYMSYPLLRWLIDRYPIFLLAAWFALIAFLSSECSFTCPAFRNPLFRGFEFALGIAFSRWILLAKRSRVVLAYVISFVISFMALSLLFSGFHPSKEAATFTPIPSIGLAGFCACWLIGNAILTEKAKRVMSLWPFFATFHFPRTRLRALRCRST